MLCECACSFYGGCVGVHVMPLPRFFQTCAAGTPPSRESCVQSQDKLWALAPWQHPLCGGPTHQDGLAKAVESQLPPTVCGCFA